MLLIKTRLGPSQIHGIGLFADEFIAAGAVTWSFLPGFDLRFPESILEQLSEPVREQFSRYSYRDPKSGLYEFCSDDARFFNHSDTPNTGSIQEASGEEIDLALRDIEPGEELTCDYRTFDDEWEKKLGRRGS
jgi:SET domain-containing protein